MGSEAPYCLDLFSRYDASFLFCFLLSEHEKERQVSREAFLYVKKVDQSADFLVLVGVRNTSCTVSRAGNTFPPPPKRSKNQ